MPKVRQDKLDRGAQPAKSEREYDRTVRKPNKQTRALRTKKRAPRSK